MSFGGISSYLFLTKIAAFSVITAQLLFVFAIGRFASKRPGVETFLSENRGLCSCLLFLMGTAQLVVGLLLLSLITQKSAPLEAAVGSFIVGGLVWFWIGILLAVTSLLERKRVRISVLGLSLNLLAVFIVVWSAFASSE